MDKAAIGDNLTPKQEQFCQEYLLDLNLTQAAIRAGYSEATAAQQASRLFNNVKIQNRIQDLKISRSERTGIDQNWVLERLKQLSDAASKEVPFVKYDYASESYEEVLDKNGDPVNKPVDIIGAIKATELLAKHVGFFEKNNEQKRVVLAPQINMLPPSE